MAIVVLKMFEVFILEARLNMVPGCSRCARFPGDAEGSKLKSHSFKVCHQCLGRQFILLSHSLCILTHIRTITRLIRYVLLHCAGLRLIVLDAQIPQNCPCMVYGITMYHLFLDRVVSVLQHHGVSGSWFLYVSLRFVCLSSKKSSIVGTGWEPWQSLSEASVRSYKACRKHGWILIDRDRS